MSFQNNNFEYERKFRRDNNISDDEDIVENEELNTSTDESSSVASIARAAIIANQMNKLADEHDDDDDDPNSLDDSPRQPAAAHASLAAMAHVPVLPSTQNATETVTTAAAAAAVVPTGADDPTATDDIQIEKRLDEKMKEIYDYFKDPSSEENSLSAAAPAQVPGLKLEAAAPAAAADEHDELNHSLADAKSDKFDNSFGDNKSDDEENNMFKKATTTETATLPGGGTLTTTTTTSTMKFSSHDFGHDDDDDDQDHGHDQDGSSLDSSLDKTSTHLTNIMNDVLKLGKVALEDEQNEANSDFDDSYDKIDHSEIVREPLSDSLKSVPPAEPVIEEEPEPESDQLNESSASDSIPDALRTFAHTAAAPSVLPPAEKRADDILSDLVRTTAAIQKLDLENEKDDMIKKRYDLSDDQFGLVSDFFGDKQKNNGISRNLLRQLLVESIKSRKNVNAREEDIDRALEALDEKNEGSTIFD